MTALLITVFLLGYAAIAFENAIGVNKAGTALITGVLCWTIIALFANATDDLITPLTHHLGGIAGIVFFLLGAMAIVELIAAHGGFDLITERISETRRVQLLWSVALLAFFLSAVLDNLTTTIVMVTLLRKLFTEQRDRLYFASAVVLAANAGGAWSPIGDVTTTMLWIGGRISTGGIILSTLVPSLVAVAVPMAALSYRFDGRITRTNPTPVAGATGRSPHRGAMLLIGVGTLLFVPVFKTLTHLPPYMGMLVGLGVMWVITARIHRDKNGAERKALSITTALERTDTPSLLFFLGILLSVAALEHAGLLEHTAQWLGRIVHQTSVIVFAMGLISAVIDNVPLVAAVQGMFSLDQFPTDHSFWHFLAYCAGTGGSALIIGSAAGVAAMGLERITFFWYLKRISIYALLGYVAGACTYLLQHLMF